MNCRVIIPLLINQVIKQLGVVLLSSQALLSLPYRGIIPGVVAEYSRPPGSSITAKTQRIDTLTKLLASLPRIKARLHQGVAL